MPQVRWTSNKKQGDSTSRIVLEGTSSNPVREIRKGGEGELSEEELSRYSKRYRFTKLDGSEGSGDGEQQGEEQGEQEAPAPQPAPGVTASATSTRRNR